MGEMMFHGVAMGGKLYSLRVARGMTQEQLAAGLCVSPGAVRSGVQVGEESVGSQCGNALGVGGFF